MGVRAEEDGRWVRMKDTPDGPKDETGDAKTMPKDKPAT